MSCEHSPVERKIMLARPPLRPFPDVVTWVFDANFKRALSLVRALYDVTNLPTDLAPLIFACLAPNEASREAEAERGYMWLVLTSSTRRTSQPARVPQSFE